MIATGRSRSGGGDGWVWGCLGRAVVWDGKGGRWSWEMGWAWVLLVASIRGQIARRKEALVGKKRMSVESCAYIELPEFTGTLQHACF